MKKKATSSAANKKAKPKTTPKSAKIKSPLPESESPMSDEKIVGSLSEIFGNKKFQSDAELNEFLESQFMAGVFPASLELDPLDEAQSLIYEAWNTEGEERVKLAERALELSENCADAYLILAQEWMDDKEDEVIVDLLEKAVKAGLRALPPNALEQHVGHFWGLMETRPFMRAKLELGKFLYELEEDEKAINHLTELIRLNPNDNQGVRYLLVSMLLENNLDSEAERILKLYAEETSTPLLFFHALLLFRKEGNSKAAQKMLKSAIKENKYVTAFLLNSKGLSQISSDFSDPGSEEEAKEFVRDHGQVWALTEGAIEWLASQVKK